jgi:hypothetical protein
MRIEFYFSPKGFGLSRIRSCSWPRQLEVNRLKSLRRRSTLAVGTAGLCPPTPGRCGRIGWAAQTGQDHPDESLETAVALVKHNRPGQRGDRADRDPEGGVPGLYELGQAMRRRRRRPAGVGMGGADRIGESAAYLRRGGIRAHAEHDEGVHTKHCVTPADLPGSGGAAHRSPPRAEAASVDRRRRCSTASAKSDHDQPRTAPTAAWASRTARSRLLGEGR